MTDNPRPPLDDKTISDESAWGFCGFCAFEVAVFDDHLVEHRRRRVGPDDSVCVGSGRKPYLPKAPREAKPIQIADLTKSARRRQQRAYWQHQRCRAREKRERERPPGRDEDGGDS